MKKAVKTLSRVIFSGASLSDCDLSPEEMAICYGVCRYYFQLTAIVDQLLLKPIKNKNKEILIYLYIALFQIMHSNHPDYAVVDSTIKAIKKSQWRWAAGLANKLLRRFIDEQTSIITKINNTDSARTAHPEWIIKLLQRDYGIGLAEQILTANNLQAPMTLRVNSNLISKEDFLAKLDSKNISAIPLKTPTAIQLSHPIPVSQIPGFKEGLCSVQDEAGQRLVEHIELHPNHRVVDACCAPGSKTCHIHETEPNLISLIGIDKDSERLKRVIENFQRLKLNQDNLKLIASDASQINKWWDKTPVDRILIDAPCSGSGVIRRHPDIKICRREEDIKSLNLIQNKLLTNLLPCLKTGGKLIYSTCSVFKDENEHLISKFAENNKLEIEFMHQWLPEAGGSDGFFIATLKKVN